MSYLTTRYNFIKDDLFLCPFVDINQGTQKLVMQKINLANDSVIFQESIDCIHVAVVDITPEDFHDYQRYGESQENLHNKSLYLRSSEQLTEIKLDPEEKFKAFKSWVAGIAEAGYDAFRIQGEIEQQAHLQYPIQDRLMRFVARAYPEFIYDYLAKIEKECVYEGAKHESSLIANLIPLLKNLRLGLTYSKNYKVDLDKLVFHIYEMCPSKKLFSHESGFLELILNNPGIEFSEICRNFDLFEMDDYKINQILAANPEAANFEVYKKFFEEQHKHFRPVVATNPKAVDFEEFELLFEDRNLNVQKALASNIGAVKFPSYENLFNSTAIQVLQGIASNPNAVKFEKFKNFFLSNNYGVLRNVAQNSKAMELDEYNNLFTNENVKIKLLLAVQEGAPDFEDYPKLFEDEHWRVRRAAANNLEAIKHTQYTSLFTDEHWRVRRSAASNPGSFKFEEYKLLLQDKTPSVKLAAKKFRIEYDEIWNKVVYPKFKSLLPEDGEINELKLVKKKKKGKPSKKKRLKLIQGDIQQKKVTDYLKDFKITNFRGHYTVEYNRQKSKQQILIQFFEK